MNDKITVITLRLPAGLLQFVSNLYTKLAYFIKINRDKKNKVSLLK